MLLNRNIGSRRCSQADSRPGSAVTRPSANFTRSTIIAFSTITDLILIIFLYITIIISFSR